MSNKTTVVEDLLALVTLVGAAFVVFALWRRGRSSPEYVSLSTVATAAWEERVAHRAAATLEVDVEQDVAVYADPRELSGVLTALLENAVEHGPAGGTVRVERTDDGFAVADDGPGIPGAERDRVFELGYSTRPDRDGLGLGLVHSVCESHDWTVRATESDSGGARVVVESVDFVTDWTDESPSTPGPDDDGRDSLAVDDAVDSSDDTAYITGGATDHRDSGERVDRAEG